MARAVASGGRSWFWAQGLACGVLVATAAPLALVLAVLFAPAVLAALMVPPGASRRQGGILLVYGLAGALPWLQALWAAAQSWPAALDLLATMRLPASCWGAQGGAWLFAQLAPFVARQVLEARVRARIARLEDARRRLRAEWGLEEG
jgi:4-amino-4-deoxy-L-arabinose transferase-like glycosyltransferase